MSTMSIADLRKRPSSTYLNHPTGVAAKAQMYGYLPPTGHYNKGQHTPMYYQPANPGYHAGGSKDMNDLADGLSRMNVQGNAYSNNKASPSRGSQVSEYGGAALGHGMPQQASEHATLPLGAHIPQAYIYNGQLMFAGPHVPHIPAQAPSVPHSPAMYGGHYAQPGYGAYPGQMYNHSPMSQTWTSSRVPSAEVPSLITPGRDSTSSHEHDMPGTPMTQYSYGGYRAGNGVAHHHSPNSIYAWGTPSPAREAFAKSQGPPAISPHLQMLIQQHPAIPDAVPAPYSPMKPLDRSLENPHGVTNVYIRGLRPETSDEMLQQIASRFGDIVSSKSIIDHNTGLCKGYGFVKYHNYKDAEDCIRAFHSLGYETSFARESFYSQLKKLGDTNSTNLYISSLPKSMNEHQLSNIFEPFKVCSSRILRDSNGVARGVGFARFDSRETCERVIAAYHNSAVTNDGETTQIQIRFADSGEQKSLKATTNQARVWRAHEYESVVNQNHAVYPLSAENSTFESYLTNNSTSGSVSNAQSRLNTVTSHLSPAASPTKVKVEAPETPVAVEA